MNYCNDSVIITADIENSKFLWDIIGTPECKLKFSEVFRFTSLHRFMPSKQFFSCFWVLISKRPQRAFCKYVHIFFR